MPDDRAVQLALARVVASGGFANSPRMSRFLRFVVEETMAGRASSLKEYAVGVHVFDKADSYDPSVDPTVRVEAAKLRAKLARYYESEGRGEALVIEIPKGGYSARFNAGAETVDDWPAPVEPAATAPASVEAASPPRIGRRGPSVTRRESRRLGPGGTVRPGRTDRGPRPERSRGGGGSRRAGPLSPVPAGSRAGGRSPDLWAGGDLA